MCGSGDVLLQYERDLQHHAVLIDLAFLDRDLLAVNPSAGDIL
jgi:hypothetical protein